MAQYHVLTRVEDGGAVALYQCIDNQQGELCVGLRQVTYTVGWYNVGSDEAISWRSSGSTETAGTAEVSPGLYRFAHLRNPFNRIGVGFRPKSKHVYELSRTAGPKGLGGSYYRRASVATRS